MSYAIGNVIYGVSADDSVYHYINENYPDEEGYDFLEGLGFEMLYSGSARYSPNYLGYSITEVDETEDIDLEELFNKLHDPEMIEKAKADFQNKAKDVPADILELLGEPKFRIVWSTS